MSQGSVRSSESVTKTSFYMGTFLWVFYITEAIFQTLKLLLQTPLKRIKVNLLGFLLTAGFLDPKLW